MARIPRPEEIPPELPARPTTVDEAYEFLRMHAKVNQEWNCDVDILKITLEAKDAEGEAYQFKRTLEFARGDIKKMAGARLLQLARQAHMFMTKVWQGLFLIDDSED